jgi:hypothetical protein
MQQKLTNTRSLNRVATEIEIVCFDRERADRTETGEDLPRRFVKVGESSPLYHNVVQLVARDAGAEIKQSIVRLSDARTER